MQLKDKAATITGAGSGVGRATALRFAEEGAKVVVADIDRDRATETAQLVEKEGGSAIAVQVDVSDDAQVQQMVAAGLFAVHGDGLRHDRHVVACPVQPLVANDVHVRPARVVVGQTPQIAGIDEGL